jgi:assimilatory nitrate reductase catalytic subunit
MFREWTSPEAVFQLLKELSRGRPCDITGIDDYQMLDERGGVQWPYPADDPPAEPQRRLFADGRFHHDDGRAKFIFESPRPLREPPNSRYPLFLLTGRGSASQWHTQTRTKKSAVLRKLYSQSVYVEINPADAQRLGIAPWEWVHVESQRGRIEARAFVTHSVPAGQVFLPMHYETVNQLTHAVFDPYSKQPAYKACAVRIQKERY